MSIRNSAPHARSILFGLLLVPVAATSQAGILDIALSLHEQAWEADYIPESAEPPIPLTEYDEFEVAELFRATTVEELEAAISDGYPMPWLEEVLRDTTIPWEDRYWLDRRMRAAIAQHLHVFFNTDNTPVQVDADRIFPGEMYWREHMLLDPVGWDVPEDTDYPWEGFGIDDGLILNPFGRTVGILSFLARSTTMSRDASIGVFTSTMDEGDWEGFDSQYYAILLYPDGSFEQIPFEELGKFNGTVSQDGNTLVFFRHATERAGFESYAEVWDRDGTLIHRIPSSEYLATYGFGISVDGEYASCVTEEGHTSLVDCHDGEIVLVTEEMGTDYSTTHTCFSPDGGYFCVGGGARGRVIEIESGEERIFPETAPANRSEGTRVFCSNAGVVTALFTTRELPERGVEWEVPALELRLVVEDWEFYMDDLNEGGYVGYCSAEVSPHGHLILISNRTGSTSSIDNTQPLLVMSISGRPQR